jgi:hypothetical protein
LRQINFDETPPSIDDSETVFVVAVAAVDESVRGSPFVALFPHRWRPSATKAFKGSSRQTRASGFDR